MPAANDIPPGMIGIQVLETICFVPAGYCFDVAEIPVESRVVRAEDCAWLAQFICGLIFQGLEVKNIHLLQYEVPENTDHN